ncbi:DEAD/DEAH box helicase [Aeromonas caviae]|jgi:superfamily II DNA/RNA helicase|uniref:DEAD/DEAH box helicase n=1 Tax=Aeromonas caviae TaxID=648 RepID=A0AAE9PJM0_AERCA|nr:MULTISPECIES: DEAD/DEAH box helicase [Aeromonas]MDU7310886.1 DEAD/DEAH box helicase [Aeromonas sp.]KDV02252.1 DEAD/DEAH box helicase [Aeromonas sp. HZM]KOG95505.1 DEAD/DEAH box helicase [Aeromonas caviae]MBL0538089.1 DEAD/DEAH box helicase [Aeromonas caviae]MBL0557318.1 DEAD/DEAH box helicase [Aeromonas caviae]
MTFDELALDPALLPLLPAALEKPTPIQQLAIPAALSGRDLLALARTGSGKTLAFGLPLLQRLDAASDRVQGLVLVPTRELASQVSAALQEIADGLGVRLLTLCGGVAQEWQERELALGPQLLVATPGRLRDLLAQQTLGLGALRMLVLDEADRLLEMGFWPDIQWLMKAMPEARQQMLFSATLPVELESLASGLLQDPVRIEAELLNSLVNDIEERLYLVNRSSKVPALIALLEAGEWPQVLVFISARDDADGVAKKLARAGMTVAALHGNKDQATREQALADFKEGRVRVLVATDLMARGIHVEALPVVINLDLPEHAPVYVHRIGRTARAGQSGLAISLTCHGDGEALEGIRALTGRPLPLAALAGFPVTDKPASGESKRAPRDKQANRRTQGKRSIKQFKGKS